MKWSRPQSGFNYPGVRWLSEGRVLKYLTKLQTEVLLFFSLKVKENTQNRERGIYS